MNALTTPASTGLASLRDLKSHIAVAKNNVIASGAQGILQFTKHGDWVLGVEKTEVGVDDLAAVNPLSFVTGYICWPKDEKLWKTGPVDEVTVPLGHATPLKHELPVHEGADWQEMAGFSLRFVEGPHAGKEAKFTTTSKGGHGATRSLMDAVMAQLDRDEANAVPVVSFGADSYIHKTWGKTFTPEIDVVRWTSMDGGTAAAPEPEPEPEAPAELGQEGERVAAAEAAPEPARRRRRA